MVVEETRPDVILDTWNWLTTSPLGYVIIFAIILVFFILLINKIKKEPTFKGVPLEKILSDQLQRQLKLTSIKGRFGFLRKEDVTLGKVLNYAIISYIGKNKDTDKKETKTSIDLFKISFNPRIPIVAQVLDMLGIGTSFLMIPQKYVKQISDERDFNYNPIYFNINPNLQVYSFANVYIYGWECYKFIEQVGWLHARKSELQELVNYAKKVVFLEVQHTKKIQEAESYYGLEKEKFSSKVSNLVPKGSSKT